MRIDSETIVSIAREIAPLFGDQKRAEHVKVKGLADFVTDVDLTVQSIMKEKLGLLYPDVAFMSEEKDNADVDLAGDFWILDPVDGTTNLIHDMRQSALSLGYCEDGILTFGVIYQPYTGEMYTAERGRGAFLNDVPIHVSQAKTMAESLIAVGTTPYQKEYADVNFDLIKRVYVASEDVRRSGSAALDLAYVAAGRLDGYFERNLKPWDYAAGTMLITEAGGHVTDFDGKAPGFGHPTDIVAGNGTIDQIILDQFIHEGMH